MSSIYKIINNNKNLIICFGDIALQFGGILPFEFLTYLSSIYKKYMRTNIFYRYASMLVS